MRSPDPARRARASQHPIAEIMRTYLLAAVLAAVVFLAALEIRLDPAFALSGAGILGLLALTVRSEPTARASQARPMPRRGTGECESRPEPRHSMSTD